MSTSRSIFARGLAPPFLAPLLAVLSTCAAAPDLALWQHCAGGALCPPGTTCSPDGDACLPLPPCNSETPAGQACEDPALACGDGIQKLSEECDDGNAINGDGCDANCKLTGCGNGIATSGELCDDGNTISGDGCEADCTPTELQSRLPGEACWLDPTGTCQHTQEPVRAPRASSSS